MLGPTIMRHGTPAQRDRHLARGSGILGGTSEILRNILGERVPGLPKD